MYPLFRVYGAFMNIKRYDHMPYYFYPSGVSIVSMQDKLLNLIDWAVDAHEETRGKKEHKINFYNRSLYLWNNWLRYQNATMANVLYDTQAPETSYQKLESVIALSNLKFYLAASAVNVLALMYMSFFFRCRRVGFVPTLAIGSAFYWAFENSNNILYKVLVDRQVLATARSCGLDAHCQPVGTRKNRGFNYQ